MFSIRISEINRGVGELVRFTIIREDGATIIAYTIADTVDLEIRKLMNETPNVREIRID